MGSVLVARMAVIVLGQSDDLAPRARHLGEGWGLEEGGGLCVSDDGRPVSKVDGAACSAQVLIF